MDEHATGCRDRMGCFFAAHDLMDLMVGDEGAGRPLVEPLKGHRIMNTTQPYKR